MKKPAQKWSVLVTDAIRANIPFFRRGSRRIQGVEGGATCVKARSNKNEALLDAMTGVLADLTALQLNSRFCRMIAYSKHPKRRDRQVKRRQS